MRGTHAECTIYSIDLVMNALGNPKPLTVSGTAADGSLRVPTDEIIYNQAILDGIRKSSECGHEVEIKIPEI